MQNLTELIETWANQRGLLENPNRQAQALKVCEEVGELASAVLKNDYPAIVDAIGDATVTLIILAKQYGLSLDYCLQEAYIAIKDRKGALQNGTFIKHNETI